MNTLNLINEQATAELARIMAALSSPGLVVFLKGELGSGKTTFVRNFLRGLNFLGSVKSPTYTLVEEYDFAQGAVYHFDLYRIVHPEELEFIGIREYFAESAIVLVEWPERGKGVLPEADLELHFHNVGDESRQVFIDGISNEGKILLNELSKRWNELKS